MNPVPTLTLLYTALTYFYEIAHITSPANLAEDVVDQGTNLAGTALGALGLGSVVKEHFQGPVAFTNYGKVSGTTHRARDGEQYFFFKGIPYARAPVGDLRFEPPVPHQGWNDIYDAKNFRSECSQVSFLTNHVDGSEDCLYLNIATRKTYESRDTPRKDLRPVLFWIHGGFYFFGGSNIYLPKYWMDEDVVVVTINYRLASFGFLNTGDGIVSGNMGLKDQVAALKWVNENIEYFNGDPSRITLIGESAGGASAHFMTMSPMAKGLFSRAISLSGTGLCHWVLENNPAPQAKDFAQALGCPINNTRSMVNCLKKLPATQLTLFHASYFGEQAERPRYYFAPTIDSGPTNSTARFLTAHPLDLLKSGQVSNVPWITGVLSGEGCINLLSILRTTSVNKEVNTNWYQHAPVLLGYQNHTDRNRVSDAVWDYYLNGTGISEETAESSVNMFSDRNFYLDNHDSAVLHSRYAPTYIYYWSHVGRFSLANVLLTDSVLPVPNDLSYLIGTGREWLLSQLINSKRGSPFGASHGDDLPIMFSMPGLRPEISESDVDYKFSKQVIRLFVSFAENGVPSTENGVKWPTVQQSNPRLNPNIALTRLDLDSEFKLVDEPFFERLNFWKNFSITFA